MNEIDLSDLYVRFWKWYNDNIDIVDFRMMEADVKGISKECILRKFKDRKRTIRRLFPEHFSSQEAKSKLYSQLNQLNSESAAELSIKLAIRGY